MSGVRPVCPSRQTRNSDADQRSPSSQPTDRESPLTRLFAASFQPRPIPSQHAAGRLNPDIVIGLFEYLLERFGGRAIWRIVGEVEAKLSCLADSVGLESAPGLFVHRQLLAEDTTISGIEIFSHGDAALT